MPRAVLNAKEIDELERKIRIHEVINLNFSGAFNNPIAFAGATGLMASFTADKDYAIIGVLASIGRESETTPLGAIALLTFQNAHTHFPIQGTNTGGIVQGDVIFAMAFGAQSASAMSPYTPCNSYLERGKSIYAHCHNPTATGRTTFMMQVSLLPIYKQ